MVPFRDDGGHPVEEACVQGADGKVPRGHCLQGVQLSPRSPQVETPSGHK